MREENSETAVVRLTTWQTTSVLPQLPQTPIGIDHSNNTTNMCSVKMCAEVISDPRPCDTSNILLEFPEVTQLCI